MGQTAGHTPASLISPRLPPTFMAGAS